MITKRWDRNQGKRVQTTEFDPALQEIIEVCKKHNISIGHEDGHGSFIVYRGFDPDNAEWLMAASIGKDPRQ